MKREPSANAKNGLGRGSFLGAAAATLLGWPSVVQASAGRGVVGVLGPSVVSASSAPRVVIVGAGLAGLTCAYRLYQAGIASTVYEASDRVGGRTWTLRDFFADGQIAEHGAEFISLGQVAVQKLARELGLQLVNVNKRESGHDVLFVDGENYPKREALADYAKVYPAVHKAVHAAGYPTKYNSYTAAGRALDNMIVTEWIDANVPGGTNSKLGHLLLVAVVEEYGGDAAQQSALNLIYLLGFERRGRLNLDGTDEALHVVGGNDQMAALMAQALPSGTVQTGTALSALRRTSSGAYRCTFESGSRTFEVIADRVCSAIPFTTLRRVDLHGIPLSHLKRTAIDKLKMGTNAKVHLQFTRRLWTAEGLDGTSYVQMPYMCSWEVSAAQRGRSGILVGYPGGRRGILDAPAHGPAPHHVTHEYLSDFERIYPGITSLWNGAAYVDAWVHDPWHLGSYSYYGVGQYTTFAGIEGEPEQNVYFCGEHTSYDFQGYMNGAVVSGERAARQIGASL